MGIVLRNPILFTSAANTRKGGPHFPHTKKPPLCTWCGKKATHTLKRITDAKITHACELCATYATLNGPYVTPNPPFPNVAH